MRKNSKIDLLMKQKSATKWRMSNEPERKQNRRLMNKQSAIDKQSKLEHSREFNRRSNKRCESASVRNKNRSDRNS